MRRFASAALIVAGLALPINSEAPVVPHDEESEKIYRLQKLHEIARYFQRENELPSVEGLCLDACLRSHNTEANKLWQDCLAEARSTLIDYQSILLQSTSELSTYDISTTHALLSGRIRAINEHNKEYHTPRHN